MVTQAAVDKMKNGGCPICHRYFLVFYILRERGLVDLVVTTFLPESPPKEVLEFSNGKRYPLVKVHKGLDARGQDMTGMECDTVDEIEALLDRFDCDEMRSRKESKAEAVAEQSFEDLYMVSQLLNTRNMRNIVSFIVDSVRKSFMHRQITFQSCLLTEIEFYILLYFVLVV